jgi:ketosteroid isomerase-like protein
MKATQNTVLLLAIAISGCATQPGTSERDRARGDLLATDAAFSKKSEAKGAAIAFYDYMAPNATTLPAGDQPVHGREAIRDSLSSVKGLLKWRPIEAEVAASGDMGYTWGTYEYQGEDPDKNPVLRYGKYVTIWKKQPDGSWKAILDCGNQNPPPK